MNIGTLIRLACFNNKRKNNNNNENRRKYFVDISWKIGYDLTSTIAKHNKTELLRGITKISLAVVVVVVPRGQMKISVDEWIFNVRVISTANGENKILSLCLT